MEKESLTCFLEPRRNKANATHIPVVNHKSIDNSSHHIFLILTNSNFGFFLGKKPETKNGKREILYLEFRQSYIVQARHEKVVIWNKRTAGFVERVQGDISPLLGRFFIWLPCDMSGKNMRKHKGAWG